MLTAVLVAGECLVERASRVWGSESELGAEAESRASEARDEQARRGENGGREVRKTVVLGAGGSSDPSRAHARSARPAGWVGVVGLSSRLERARARANQLRTDAPHTTIDLDWRTLELTALCAYYTKIRGYFRCRSQRCGPGHVDWLQS